MSDRGDEVAVDSAPDCALAFGAFAWEQAGTLGTAPGWARRGNVIVVADASLYYLDDLRRRCEARSDGSSTEAGLILDAYHHWGDECPGHLEGDFAFILWDGDRRRLLAARDFAGTRPLFYAHSDGIVSVASSIGAVLASCDVSREYNLCALAEDAAGVATTVRDETCYRAIKRLPAGWTLLMEQDRLPRTEPHWEVPIFGTSPSHGSFEESAEELQALLVDAVTTRIHGVDRPAVWMSGGYDSTAVFGAGSSAGRRLTPVSMRYPPDDPGYEDPWIESAAAHWNAEVRWTDVDAVPPLDRPYQRAAQRDEPFAHKFEMWNRALARTTRSAGAHVALGGNGGDQLFQVSPVYLGDLWRQLHWGLLNREWRRAYRGAGFRFLFRWAVQPNLPQTALDLAGLARGGRPLVHYLQDRPPPWIRSDFLTRSGLGQRLAQRVERRAGESLASVETSWYFRAGFGARVNALVNSIGLWEGVALRSPLYDGRLVQFAASIPRPYRTAGGEGKLVLRQAARSFLPADVVAPRPRRTGLPGGYLARTLPDSLSEMMESAGVCSHLADLGIIDPGKLLASCRAYLDDPAGNGSLGPPAYDAFATEMWLDSHS
jgi:asparagine synthase (glutamine-hydrolysing)